jgi:hypothetical protein
MRKIDNLFPPVSGRAEECHRGRYNEKTMILDLNDVLDQFQAWNRSESGIRITTAGKSWVTNSLNVGKDSILFDQKGAELGSVQTLNLAARGGSNSLTLSGAR